MRKKPATGSAIKPRLREAVENREAGEKSSAVLFLLFVCLVVLLPACRNEELKPTPEAARRMLKLRGYQFDEKAFAAAVGAEDLAAVNAFLAAGMSPNVRDDPDGDTMLILAATRGARGIVTSLINHGADINAKGRGGSLALFSALRENHDDVADLIVTRHELDLTSRGANGMTPLIIYAWRGRKEIVRDLLDRGARVTDQDSGGDTALHGAASKGEVEILTMLLAKGANPNAQNSVGGTPLMLAASQGRDEAVQVLLDHGADPRLKDSDGMTAADWGRHNRQQSVVELLQARARTANARP
jgi:uncharacterized protein